MSRARARIQPGDGDRRHGTAYGYRDLACRCQSCRDAHAAAFRAQQRERSQRLHLATHGKASTYNNWNCRCRPCTDAWAVRCLAYQRKRRAS